jgi:L-glutamine:2-deoxy-scyllo-inosose/3-amino-2,3-dideoxy-scyllo-inosose aminotransferase
VIAYAAIMTKRYVVEGRSIPRVANAPTAVRSFEATWTSMPKAGVRPVFVDVDPDTGCSTAAQLEAAIDANTAFLAVPALYDRTPDVASIRALADRLDIGFVLDCAHGHLVRWDGHHVSKYADITTISGQGSKIVTPGWEAGLIVVFDEMLAALVTKLRNVGRAPSPLPMWWPAGVPRVAGENARLGEIPAILLAGSFDSYDELSATRSVGLKEIRAGLADYSGPWRMLPEQPQSDGIFYKAHLMFDPARADKRDAWAQIGYAAAGRMLAQELLTEVAASYPPPWEAASEYHPESRPWQWAGLVPEIDRAAFPNASRFAARAHMLPHEFLGREECADQLLGALHKLSHWADDPDVLAWAATQR